MKELLKVIVTRKKYANKFSKEAQKRNDTWGEAYNYGRYIAYFAIEKELKILISAHESKTDDTPIS